MQRQSLGSPGSNHHSHGGVTVVNSPLTAATESPLDSKRLPLTTPSLAFTDDDDEKTKLLKSSSLTAALALKQKKKTPEKIIHGIPILIFFCFLILYLSSHDPSQLELDAFGGFKKRPETITASFLETRSVRGVMQIGDTAAVSTRLHRKLGDF